MRYVIINRLIASFAGWIHCGRAIDPAGSYRPLFLATILIESMFAARSGRSFKRSRFFAGVD
jgi:hypothetical protein